MGGARFSFYPCVIGVSFLYSLGSSSMVMLGFLLVPQSLAAVWWICRLARSKSISISKRTGIWCCCKSDPFRALDGQKPSEKHCLNGLAEKRFDPFIGLSCHVWVVAGFLILLLISTRLGMPVMVVPIFFGLYFLIPIFISRVSAELGLCVHGLSGL